MSIIEGKGFTKCYSNSNYNCANSNVWSTDDEQRHKQNFWFSSDDGQTLPNVSVGVFVNKVQWTSVCSRTNEPQDDKKEQKDAKGFTNIVIPSNKQKADETSIKIDVNLSLI